MTTKKIWAAGAALTLAALALPYGTAYAVDEAAPTMTAQVTKATSSSRQASSEVTVEGTWATPKPAPAPSTVPAPQERLAKTGATTDGLVLAIGIIAFGSGGGLVILRLLEGRKHDEETTR